ncbi:hypothetical protein ACWGDE_27340 [Streptomyces sp. NPDC054956]
MTAQAGPDGAAHSTDQPSGQAPEADAPRTQPLTETPIYDAVERLWLQQGREVPHAPAPGQDHRDGDLFHRA